MKMMGYHYLTLENLKRFLENPFTSGSHLWQWF